MTFVRTNDPKYNAQMEQLDKMQTQIQPAYDQAVGDTKLINDSQNGTLDSEMAALAKKYGQSPQMGAGPTTPTPTQPSSEEMVTIQNDQTGQKILVPKSQLGQYQMSDGSNQGQNPAPASSPSFANGQSAIGGNVPVTTQAQSASAPNFINPQGGQEASDQQQAQQMWRGSKNLAQQDNIASSWAASHGYDLFGQKPLTGQQANLQEINRKGADERSKVQHALDALNKVSSLARGHSWLGILASDLPNTSSHTYQQIKSNLGDIGKDLPDVNDTHEQAQTKIQQLDANLRTNYGYGLDGKYLESFGMKRDQDGNPVDAKNAGNTNKNDVPGRVLAGAGNDVMGMLKGVASIPGGYLDAALKGRDPWSHTEDLGTQIAKGVVNEYGDLVGASTQNGQPILPQDKSVFQKGGINLPTKLDLEKAKNHLIDHPINSALDVIPVLGPAAKVLKGLGVVGEGAEAANLAGAAADAGKAAETTGGLAKTADITNTVEKTSEVAPKAVVKDVPLDPVDVNSFKSQFTVPQKRAVTKDLNLEGTTQEVMQHIKSGMSSENLKDIPSQVTGDSGIITKMTRDAVAKIPGEVDLGKPAEAANNVLDHTRGISDRDREVVLKNIQDAQNVSQGQEIGKLNIQEAYDQARQLQTLAHDEMRSSTYLTPNNAAEGVGKAYLAAADDMMEQIESAAKDHNTIDTVKTPENLAALEKISPRLAQQVQNAKSIKDLRRTASPFVKLEQIMDLTETSKNSTFGKVANQMQGTHGPVANASKVVGKIAGAAAGSVFGPAGMMAGSEIGGNVARTGGMLVDKALGPHYVRMTERVIPKVQGVVNKSVGTTMKGGKALFKSASAAKNVGKYSRFFPQQQSN